ncbi:MAG: transcriptional repressor [Magnetococcus sp. WYHC-3]
MNIYHDTVEARVAWLQEQLRARGQRVTHQRVEVFRAVVQTDTHPTAEEVFQGVRVRIPSLSRSTAYQTLQFLVDQGYVKAPFGTHHSTTRYDGNCAQHHHLVCVRCGLVTDMEPPQPVTPALPQEMGHWGRVETVHLEFRGVCAGCLAQSLPESGDST